MSGGNELQPRMDRIELIDCSLKYFAHGLIGLVPVLGLPSSIAAIIGFLRVRRRQGLEWNPAQRYLKAGLLCGSLGLMLNFIVIGIITALVLNGSLTQ